VTSLNVALDPSSPGLPAYFATLATLPVSFTPSPPSAVPDVTVIDGRTEWPHHAARAIRDGVRGIVVSDPRVTSASTVSELALTAERAGVPVELAEPFAGDPAFEEHGARIAEQSDGLSGVFLTENRTDANGAPAALSVLRTLRAMRLDVGVRSIATTAVGLSIVGWAGDTPVLAHTTRSGVRSGQRVQGIGATHNIDLVLHGSSNAAPALITITSVSDSSRLPTVYETADRAAWRRVARALESGQQSYGSLAGFAADVEVATSMTPVR
jgi:hypothetical protein